ncbi:uncharacterized protein [Diabrotica undecimpunctata]|uniref:uncharacterized protein n=1 Tax=Diabrotica undecimpunctata TaxID=50387 RepID=UPI003B63EE30
MDFLFITCVALGISQCLSAPTDLNTTFTGKIEECANFTALKLNQTEILDTCKPFFNLSQTQIIESRNETGILCTLYNHTLISYCRSNNTVRYPTISEIKLKNYTLDSVCKSVVKSSQSIFPTFKQHSCWRTCTTLFNEEELQPACLFAHYYYLQTTNVTEKTVIPVAVPHNPPEIVNQPIHEEPPEQQPSKNLHVPDQPQQPVLQGGLPAVNVDSQAVVPPPKNEQSVDSKKVNAANVPIASEDAKEDPKLEDTKKAETLSPKISTSTTVKVSEPGQAPAPVPVDVNIAQPNPDDAMMNEDDEDEGIHGGDDNEYADGPPGPAKPETVKAEPKAVDRKPDTTVQEISPVSDDNLDVVDGESPFFSYFMVICVVFVLGYVAYHNRIKVMALLLEGKRNKRQNRGRRPNSANYHKLDSNLEEAISSNVTKNSSNVIY